jgi:hypothetical protein
VVGNKVIDGLENGLGERKDPAPVLALKFGTEKKARKWMWFGLAALAAIQLYYVQEMLAALLIFAVLFAVVSAVALTVYLLDRAGERALDWAEPYATKAAHAVAGQWPSLDEAKKRLLRRPHSETAR